jgi:hypothetical protein
MWISWRHEMKKPLSNSFSSKDKFILCNNDEFSDFSSFKSALRFLDTSDNYYIPYSLLLKTGLKETESSAVLIEKYNKMYYQLSFDALLKVANWMLDKEPGLIAN